MNNRSQQQQQQQQRRLDDEQQRLNDWIINSSTAAVSSWATARYVAQRHQQQVPHEHSGAIYHGSTPSPTTWKRRQQQRRQQRQQQLDDDDEQQQQPRLLRQHPDLGTIGVPNVAAAPAATVATTRITSQPTAAGVPNVAAATAVSTRATATSSPSPSTWGPPLYTVWHHLGGGSPNQQPGTRIYNMATRTTPPSAQPNSTSSSRSPGVVRELFPPEPEVHQRSSSPIIRNAVAAAARFAGATARAVTSDEDSDANSEHFYTPQNPFQEEHRSPIRNVVPDAVAPPPQAILAPESRRSLQAVVANAVAARSSNSVDAGRILEVVLEVVLEDADEILDMANVIIDSRLG